MHLSQQQISVPSSHAKGISIEKGHSRDDDPLVSKLGEEIDVLKHQNIEKDLLIGHHDIRIADVEADNALKSKKVSDLQTHLGTLTACYYDLKRKLAEELGDRFKSSVEEFRVGQSSQEPPVDSHIVRRTQVVNRFEKGTNSSTLPSFVKTCQISSIC